MPLATVTTEKDDNNEKERAAYAAYRAACRRDEFIEALILPFARGRDGMLDDEGSAESIIDPLALAVLDEIRDAYDVDVEVGRPAAEAEEGPRDCQARRRSVREALESIAAGLGEMAARARDLE